MAKNMYQKRKERKQNKTNNENEKKVTKTNINWGISADVKPLTNLDKIRIFVK